MHSPALLARPGVGCRGEALEAGSLGWSKAGRRGGGAGDGWPVPRAPPGRLSTGDPGLPAQTLHLLTLGHQTLEYLGVSGCGRGCWDPSTPCHPASTTR